MADKNIGIALVLSMQNKASMVIDEFVNKTQKKLENLKSITGRLADKSFNNGSQLIATGAAIGGPIMEMVNLYGKQQDAFLTMQTSMLKPGGVYDKQMYQSLVAEASRLSNMFAKNATEYAEMENVFIQAGIKPKAIMEGLGESTAKFAMILKATPSAAAELTAVLKNDFNQTDAQLKAVQETISRTYYALGKKMSGDEIIHQFEEAFSKQSMLTDILGKYDAKSASVLTAFGMKKGFSASVVGDMMRKTLDSLMDPALLGKMDAAAKMVHLKLQFFDKDHQFMGVDNWLEQMHKLQNLNPMALTEILKPFGGKQGKSVDFLKDLGTKAGFEKIMEMRERIEDQGDMNAKYNVIIQSMNNQLEIAKTSAENAGAALGEVLAPSLTKVYTSLNDLAVTVTQFIKNHRDLAEGFMKTAATIAVASLAGGYLSFVVSGLAKGVNLLTTAFSKGLSLAKWLTDVNGLQFALFRLQYFIKFNVIPAITSFITTISEFGAALLANPITWYVAAALALAAAIYLLWKNWEKMSTSTKIFLGILSPIAVLPVAIIKNWSAIQSFFINTWSSITTFFTNTWSSIKSFFINTWSSITTFFTKIWSSIASFFTKIWQTFTLIHNIAYHVITAVWAKIGPFFKAAFNLVITIVEFTAKWLLTMMVWPVSLIIHYWKPISTFFSNMWQAISFKAQEAWSVIVSVWNKVTSFFSNLWDAVSLKTKLVWYQVTSVFSSTWASIKRILSIALSDLVHFIIKYKPKTLILAFQKIPVALNAVWQTVKTKAILVWDEIKSLFTNVKDYIENFATTLFNSGRKIITNIKDGIMHEVHVVTAAMQLVTSKMREYLPFSPAKTGPLSDIHKLKFLETIAASLRPAQLVSKLTETFGKVRDVLTFNELGKSLANGFIVSFISTLSLLPQKVNAEMQRIQPQITTGAFFSPGHPSYDNPFQQAHETNKPLQIRQTLPTNTNQSSTTNKPNINITINLTSSGDAKKDATTISDELEKRLDKWWKQKQQNKDRTSYK